MAWLIYMNVPCHGGCPAHVNDPSKAFITISSLHPPLSSPFSLSSPLYYFLKLVYFLYLAAPGLSCGIWDPVPSPGIKPSPPALGAENLTTGPLGKSCLALFRGDYWVPFVLLMLKMESTFVTGSTHRLQQWSEVWSRQEMGHSGTVWEVLALSMPLAKDSRGHWLVLCMYLPGSLDGPVSSGYTWICHFTGTLSSWLVAIARK